MKPWKIFLLIVAVVFLFTAAFPSPAIASSTAASTTSKLTITNKALGPTYVYLTGPKSYTINAAVGKTIQDVQKGDYTYKYKACGVEKTGKLSAKGAQARLTISACKVATVILYNMGSGVTSLTLSGPANYTLTAGPDTVTRQVILEGTYKWKLMASCGSKTGTAVIRGKKNLFWSSC